MHNGVRLISKSIDGGTLHLDVVLEGPACFLISGRGGVFDDFHNEYFLDVNTAVRVFNQRIKAIAAGEKIATWCHHLSPDSADTLSAPVRGLQAYLAAVDPDAAGETTLRLLLEPWTEKYEIGADDILSLGIPDHGVQILRETTSEGHDLALYMTKHPARIMTGRNRFVLRLASLKEVDGSPAEENVEYFYDIRLARRAFEQRLLNDSHEPTRLGMEGGTARAHFDYRNAILLEDAISIRRADADEILARMIRSGIYDECEGLYHHLRDARDAAYSGNLVKWLGSVTVQPDGSGIYASDRTKPFEMHIKVEVPPEDIERTEDGSISFALCYFTGHYNYEDWHEDKDCVDIPYTDDGVEKSVNAFLKGIGLDGTVNWSEHGRQKAGEADFDMDYELIDQIWPDLRLRTDAAPVSVP